MQKKQYFGASIVVFLAVLASVVVAGLYANMNYVQPGSGLQSADGLLDDVVVRQTEETVSMVFMGDVMLARSIGRAIDQGDTPFQYVQDTINDYDIRIINLETTIADQPSISPAAKPYTFNAPLSAIDVLTDANIDVSSLANNHTGDYGRTGTIDTIDRLVAAGLGVVGAGKTVDEAFAPVLISRGAGLFAFIAVNDVELSFTQVSESQAGSAYLDEDRIVASIQQARDAGADVVTILPHWGIEYSPSASARQQAWARTMIDNGADLVIGSHPHVVQPTEAYNGGQIVYSLGNFIFDGMPAEARIAQMIGVDIELRSIVSGDELIDTSVSIGQVESIAVQIGDNGYPTLP